MIFFNNRWKRPIGLAFALSYLICGVAPPLAIAQDNQVTIAESVVSRALPAELGEMFPIGREFKGVSIPSYSGDELRSVMNAQIIKRIDEEFLDLTGLVITVYSGEGKEQTETVIQMARAEYHLLNGQLTSKTTATIEQPQFTMTSDQMIFETHTEISRMNGNVVVIVPDAGSFAPDFQGASK